MIQMKAKQEPNLNHYVCIIERRATKISETFNITEHGKGDEINLKLRPSHTLPLVLFHQEQ